MSIPRTPVDTVRTRTGANLFFFDGLNTDYVVADGENILGHATTWNAATALQTSKGGRIRLNGRDFILTDPSAIHA